MLYGRVDPCKESSCCHRTSALDRGHVFAVLITFASTAGITSAPARAASAAAGHDYLKTKGLSQPTYDYKTQVVRDTVLLPMADGEGVYLEITRPDDGLRHPVIFEASPYHGTLADRDGTRILPEPRDSNAQSLGLTRYFAPRGYAVVMMDLRGTGKSEGCLDHLGKKGRSDLKEVIE